MLLSKEVPMFAPLKQWFSRSAAGHNSGREGSRAPFRPKVEALEERQLLSAYPIVNAYVNEDFVLYQGGILRKIDHNFFNHKTNLDSNVVSVSVADGWSRGVATYVKTDGSAWEWNDTDGFTALYNSALGITNNVCSVAADSYGGAFILRNDSTLFFWGGKYDNRWFNLGGNVRSVSAGTDAYGDSSCDVVSWYGTAYTWDEGGYFNFQLTNPSLGITNNVRSVAAGENGAIFVLRNDSVLFYYDQLTNTWANLGGNVRAVTAGTNANDGPMADIVTGDGTAWEWSMLHPWDGSHGYYRQLVNTAAGITNNVRSVGAGQKDVSDVVLNDGSLWQYHDQTRQWTKLDTGVA
jgi:hypothetical protein